MSMQNALVIEHLLMIQNITKRENTVFNDTIIAFIVDSLNKNEQ